MRRISRGTPAMLTTQEQEQFVRLLDVTPGLADAIETLLNRKLASMTFGEKLQAVHEFLEMGHSAAAFSQAARAVKDLQLLAQDAKGEVSAADKVQLLEAQLTLKNEHLAQEKERSRLLLAQITTIKAEPARAVNSGEPDPPLPHTRTPATPSRSRANKSA